ncbi:hypothetical protein GCM10008995_26520 [Halobellus salinus]|uniref:Uncharacterized protein n=1 Tax=Halobellus salinus TaxID=931585 RepID=A0A830EIP1_9EURY|nr:hypothetical protein [Halobellus salinus]GGJ15383.1 hypothetical protein GCM10008995_26520 [Halobellus salinus]SMP25111.1 hypothetical protein SAMN06265347_110108 [Halobellus salinus]
MREEEPDIEIPDGWTVSQYKFSGNFKLIAEFEHKESGAEVRCMPYKTYSDQPGFCNAHRVILVDPDDGVEEIAVGMELEYVEDAEHAALEAMKKYSEGL